MGALDVVDLASIDDRALCSSNAAAKNFTSSLRSLCHDFVRSFIAKGSDGPRPREGVVALRGRPIRGSLFGEYPGDVDGGEGREICFCRGVPFGGVCESDFDMLRWGLGVRANCVGGTGEMGTFHMTASSGTSSSES